MFQRRPSDSGSASHIQPHPTTEEHPPNINEFNVFRRRSSLGPDESGFENGRTEVLERLSSSEEAVQDDFDPVQTLRGDFEERMGEHQGEGMNMLRRQRRNSRLQRFRDLMNSEEELDEAGRTYAKLM
ncbi:hypothetical protein BDV06DRAFT_188189 [Aspergillus oleicola]